MMLGSSFSLVHAERWRSPPQAKHGLPLHNARSLHNPQTSVGSRPKSCQNGKLLKALYTRAAKPTVLYCTLQHGIFEAS